MKRLFRKVVCMILAVILMADVPVNTEAAARKCKLNCSFVVGIEARDDVVGIEASDDESGLMGVLKAEKSKVFRQGKIYKVACTFTRKSIIKAVAKVYGKSPLVDSTEIEKALSKKKIYPVLIGYYIVNGDKLLKISNLSGKVTYNNGIDEFPFGLRCDSQDGHLGLSLLSAGNTAVDNNKKYKCVFSFKVDKILKR